MKNELKCDEIRDFIRENMLTKALNSAYRKGDKKAIGIIESMVKQLYKFNSPDKLMRYYRNIVRCGTPRLKYVSKYLHDRKIMRLEDIENEFNKKFNRKWLKK